MGRTRNSLPTYLHAQSGRARAVWTDTLGIRHFRMLPGKYDSKESKAAYGRLVDELASSPAASLDDPDEITVSELFVAFIEHAEQHYVRPDGTQTTEVSEFKALSKFVRLMYGSTLAREFDTLKLQAVRHRMIGRGWCRNLINQRVGRLRRVFRWASGQKLVPGAVHYDLTTLADLQLGRSKARETAPVEPVSDAMVDAALPHMNRFVRAMVEFQRLTGCRPGEVCRLRRSNIDTGGTVWLFTLADHKLAYRGKPRIIAIGPRAQEVIRPFFTPNLDEYLFSPARAMEEFRVGLRTRRQTAVQPSQQNRAKRKPKKKPGPRYTSRSYAKAITTAIEKANAAGMTKARASGSESEYRSIEAWHPNRLRHSHATKVRKSFSLEHAGAALGHSKLSTTQVYAERDAGLAVEVAMKLG